MKTILLSIQPKHLVNILNGNKTLELRKTVPKDYVGWVYMYCTKGKPYYEPRVDAITKQKVWNIHNDFIYHTDLNGKVVARFWFDEYDTYYWNEYQGQYRLISKDKERFVSAIMNYDELCLNEKQVNDYGNEKHLLYTWHIKKLEIFDTPLSLNDFYKATLYAFVQVIEEYEKRTNDFSYRLKKAPQSWQYVYIRKD